MPETPAASAKAEFGNFIRTATRPVLTLIGMVTWAALVLDGVDPPQDFKLLVGAMVGTFFGERAIARLQGRQP